MSLKTKKALPEPNPTAPPSCFYPGNECLSPSKLTLRKGVNDEGKRPPEGGKKRPSTAAGRSVDAQEKDGVGTDEQDEVEAHRGTGCREEAEPIDDGDERVRQALHRALQSEAPGRANGQRDPHEGQGDEQRGGQHEEEICEEKNEGDAAEIVATEREGADLSSQADGHEPPREGDPPAAHIDEAGYAGREQKDE